VEWMTDKRSRAAAFAVVAILAACCVGLAAVLLPGCLDAFSRVATDIANGTAETAAVAAMAGGLAVAVACSILSVPVALALCRLPGRWARLARSLLLFPAFTVLCAVVMRQVAGVAGMPTPAVFLGCVVALLLPWASAQLARAVRRIDPVALRAAASLGAGWRQVLGRIILPALLPCMTRNAIGAFAIGAAGFLLRGVDPAPFPRDFASAAALVAAILSVASLLLPQRGMHEVGGGEILDGAADRLEQGDLVR